ncbi:MAG: sulfatase-like hydrolase/transferase [Akkermansiaceae bacterium]
MMLLRFVAVALLSFTGSQVLSADTAKARKPNVILIMADDLGYRDLGCYGHPEIKTPVLDKMAKEGTRLTNFHSGATVCTPSRMALLTGSYPVRLGWTQGVAGYKMGARDGLSPEALTIAEIFKSEGYATGISGKWHIGNLPETRPHAQGFDDNYYIPLSNNQTKQIQSGDEIVEKPFDNRQLTKQFTDQALRFVRANREKPFFLYLPYTAPHFPVEAHPDWKGKSSFGAYGDVVEELDSRIGSIFTLLKELKIDEHTIVIFTSDNGPQGGEKASPFPFRGGKWSALEGGTRVPCIIRWPGNIPGGRELKKLVAAIDFLPSLSRACGIDWQSKTKNNIKVDGLDVWDTLTGVESPHPRKELIYWHGMHAEPQAVQVAGWKLFFEHTSALVALKPQMTTPEQMTKLNAYQKSLGENPAPRSFLSHLPEDLGEVNDLSEEHPQKVEDLKERAEVLMNEVNAGEKLEIFKAK